MGGASRPDLEERVRLLEEAIVEHGRILSALCGKGSVPHARLIEREAAGDCAAELDRKPPDRSRRSAPLRNRGS